MDLRLIGKKAIVTGGTRGIGRAIADTLADEGCSVAICARNADQISEAVEAFKSKGVSAFGGVVDIANAAVFLASPCSSFTTGINMIVDGTITDRVNY